MTDLHHHGDAEPAPGLTAVRDPDTSRAFAAGLAAILGGTARLRSAAVAVPTDL